MRTQWTLCSVVTLVVLVDCAIALESLLQQTHENDGVGARPSSGGSDHLADDGAWAQTRDTFLSTPVPFAMIEVGDLSLWTECNRMHLTSPKHGAAIWFFSRLLTHRWRVPIGDARAKVVVIPALIDWHSRGHCGTRPWYQHLTNLTDAVRASLRAVPEALSMKWKELPHLLIAQDFMS